jgi:2-succinyl-6-hydroxy-2,4-cyclohexadiene-1-carboxylate synthase
MARFTINGLDLFIEQWNETAQKTVVFLHGFTGSTKTWHRVVEQLPKDVRYIAVDLIGHGKSAAPQNVAPYSMEAQISQLEELFKVLNIECFTLLGYSMGGRVALSYAARYASRIEQLILESASPGLAEKEERLMRKQSDELLADRILTNGVASFVNKWENIPLFASQKTLSEELQQQIRQERLEQRAIGLANSLRGMGTGVMPALWDELKTLQMPVTLITGEFDEKFIGLNKRMQTSISKASHITISQVGHAIHVENPTKFATIVKETI